MKLTPYKKLLTMAKELKDNALAPIRSMEMKKQAELETVKLEGEILKQQQRIEEYCQEYPCDFGKIIDAIDEKVLLERRKDQFGKIIEQMFPE
jgi:hypothetical protein